MIDEKALSDLVRTFMLKEARGKLTERPDGSLDDEDSNWGFDPADLSHAILSLIRPAFEAKDAESEQWQNLFESTSASFQQEIRRLEAKLAQAVEALESATAFDLGDEIVVESRGKGRWVVRNFSSVLNTDGFWEWEPRPSSRDDDFIARTRFSRDEAFDHARAASAAARGETR